MHTIDADGLRGFGASNLLVETTGRVFRSRLPNLATEFSLGNGTAYFIYVGRTAQPLVIGYVDYYVSTSGAGTNTAEVGLFSSTGVPNNSAQALTKLAAAAWPNIGSLLSTGVKSNNTSFNYTVPVGTYLWAGIRTTGYSTAPKLSGLCMDWGDGLVLSTTSAGALTGAGPWNGSLIASPAYLNTAIVPDLRVR